LWTHEHQTSYGLADSTPVWAPGNLLFVASAYGTGARVLELHPVRRKNDGAGALV